MLADDLHGHGLLCARLSTAACQPVCPLDLPGRLGPDIALMRSANFSTTCKTKALFKSDNACRGVVVTARRGDVVDGSGQSSTSNSGLRPLRAHTRYSVRRLKIAFVGSSGAYRVACVPDAMLGFIS